MEHTNNINVNDGFKPQYVDVTIQVGGPRPGAGRKEVSDKKQQIQIMVYGSVVAKIGGKKAVQEFLRRCVDNEAERLANEESNKETDTNEIKNTM